MITLMEMGALLVEDQCSVHGWQNTITWRFANLQVF